MNSATLCHLANLSGRDGAKASAAEIQMRLGRIEPNADARDDLEPTGV